MLGASKTLPISQINIQFHEKILCLMLLLNILFAIALIMDNLCPVLHKFQLSIAIWNPREQASCSSRNTTVCWLADSTVPLPVMECSEKLMHFYLPPPLGLSNVTHNTDQYGGRPRQAQAIHQPCLLIVFVRQAICSTDMSPTVWTGDVMIQYDIDDQW